MIQRYKTIRERETQKPGALERKIYGFKEMLFLKLKV